MLALMVAGCAGQAALAQIAPGYSGTSSLTIIEDEEAFRMLRAYGSCFAMRQPAEALALIAAAPGSSVEADTFRRRVRRTSLVCLGGETELHMPMYMLRGAIAEGLYRRGVVLPPDLALPIPAPGAPTRTLAEAARCYIAGHRDQVRALIDQTQMGSREEYARLSEMAPDFFLCLPEGYRGGQFSTVLIRGRLAEALYRMPAPTPAPAREE